MTTAEYTRRRAGWAIVGILSAFLVGAVLAGVVAIAQVRATQVDRLPQTEKNDETLAIVKDCTQPGGKCFNESQRRTAKAVGDIGRYSVLAAACAADVDPKDPVEKRIADITACVTERLAR